MKMFLLGFIVRADTGRSQFESAKRIDALGWIRCADANTALLKARFEIESDGWKIVKLEQPPVEVSRQLSIEDDTVRAQFEKAVKKGAAFIYSVVGGDFKATGPVVLERDTGIDIGLFLETQKKLKRTGRCLHFNAGHQCNAVINAHSVQKGQSLVSIAVDGKVYGLAEKMSDYGKAQFIKKGIKIFSTFRGFCKKHDNAVFLPIDTRALIPNEQQVLLYAYRSICMEVFVKENSLNLYNLVINETKKDSPLLQQFKSNLQGTKNGLIPLLAKKRLLDKLLEAKKFDSIEYLFIECSQEPIMFFSGLFYPEFDFQGRELQTLDKINEEFSLMTFCSAPSDNGWGILFAWHKNDAIICRLFIESISCLLSDGSNLGDALFRLTLATCENVAFAPDWWESLANPLREQICEFVTSNADPMTMIDPNYIKSGFEDIVSLKFERFYSNM